VTATSKVNDRAPSMQPVEAGPHAIDAARVPTRRDLSVRALQTVYLGVACYVGLSDCADHFEAIARGDA
jgi:hypothetical protein